jgi:hypothetical protein
MQFGGGECGPDLPEPMAIAHDAEQDERPEADGPPPLVPRTFPGPRDVNCPHCGAVAGTACKTSAGVRYRGGPKGQRTIHSGRIDAWDEITRLAAAQLVEDAEG